MPAFDKVDPQLDFPKEEKEVLRFWKERNVFHRSLEQRRGKERFVFFEGPPTANGLPHNGHVLTRVIKDLFPRYQTMRGKYVGRKAGWDTHGLPVEVEVEKELRIHGKAAIEAYGVEPFIAKCIDSVFRYTKEWEELTERIGFWVDLDQAYVTYHKSYVESVWWALSQLFEKGLLYQGHKVVWWWAQGGTALSAAEVGQGYKPVDDPSVYVAFPLAGSDESLLVWTTTPWTLPSNSYAAVHPDFDYALVEAKGRKLWVAKGLLEPLAKKLGVDKLTPLAEKKGKDLVGLRYAPPFDLYAAEARHYFRVIAAEFVTLDTGSGIVHIAPAFGEDDFDAHKKELAKLSDPTSVPLLCAVKADGTFVAELATYAGRWVKDCDKEIVRELDHRGALVHHETYRHDYPFCLRADQDPLIQFARPAWYIRTTREIDRAIANNQAVRWLPDHIKEGRMGDFLRNNVDWALSRERWWGTPLNIWVCDQDAEHKEAPSSVEAILAKNPKAFDHFHEARKKDPKLNEHLVVHKPWVDQVTFGCAKCGGTMRRVPEVIDCWFDSGCMPFAQWGFPHVAGSKGRLGESWPADFISEAIDQTRGWFYSLLMISTMVFDEPTCAAHGLRPRLPHPFETCIVLGHVCDKEGKKESKSKGNYTPPDLVFDDVKLEFAVFGKDTHPKVKGDPGAGKVWVAPEDHEGMDLPAKATGMVLRSLAGKEIKVEVETKKGLPRRVLVVSDADLATLGLRATPKHDVKPSLVGWLPAEERVVLEDPGQPAPGADAFRSFFYASSPPWSNTRHALSNVRTLQKDFLVKLRNTWSFFTIYANIDGFDPSAPKGDPAKRSELDRWILSELHQTVRGVTADLDAYLVYEATQKLSALVESLSNWWVRRSRERFWRAGWDADKRAAHETLYECLVTIAKLAAPFVPFMADAMYRNLTKPLGASAQESVHLCDWPAADTTKIDDALSAKMAAVRDVVSLGLQARTSAKLKVRQPLRAAHLVVAKAELRRGLEEEAALIKDELNVLELHFAAGDRVGELATPTLKPNFRTLGQRGLGKEAQDLKKMMAALTPEAAVALHADIVAGKGHVTVGTRALELTSQDVEVAYTTKPGWVAAGDRVGVIALETELDDELRDLGLLRELTSRVQTVRKEERLEFTDRIALGVVGGERTQRVVAKYGAELARVVLATKLGAEALAGAAARETEIEGEKVTLFVARLP